MAKASAVPSWHRLAQPSSQKRARWAHGLNRTRWVSCGRVWDAVAITPLERGLDALAGLRIGPNRGCLVLVDHLRGVLYVMVPPGSGDVLVGVPGVRVLSDGNELLMPATYDDSTASADLISYPREDEPPRPGTRRPTRRQAERLHRCIRRGARVMNGYTVLYDPEGRIDAELPLDRQTHERLARAVLAWSDPAALQPDDYEQVGLLLAGAAHAVAADVRESARKLPNDDGRRLLAEIVLREADGRLAQRSRTLHGVKNKARLLRALYERLDRLQDTVPAVEAATSVSP